MNDWVKETAREVRADLKAAQQDGRIPPQWDLSVRIERASLMVAVNVRVLNCVDIGEWTFEEGWSEWARDLSDTLHNILAPYLLQADQKHRFLNIYFGTGRAAPPPRDTTNHHDVVTTSGDVRARVAAIAGITDDDEMAHSEEDRLYAAVLMAIADGATDPATLAAEALATRKLTFARWGA